METFGLVLGFVCWVDDGGVKDALGASLGVLFAVSSAFGLRT